MATTLKSESIIYPDSDGKPMADNTKQFRWIVSIKENLEYLFLKDENVFVGGDLLWHPVEGRPDIRVAPDTLVVFGRPKGESPEATLCERGSYRQWQEGNIPPQVVFEILSPGNTMGEMSRKLLFYNRYGVEEYYIYDPEGNLFLPPVEMKAKAEREFQRAEQEKSRADREALNAQQEKARADRLAKKLRELGIDPQEV